MRLSALIVAGLCSSPVLADLALFLEVEIQQILRLQQEAPHTPPPLIYGVVTLQSGQAIVWTSSGRKTVESAFPGYRFIARVGDSLEFENADGQRVRWPLVAYGGKP